MEVGDALGASAQLRYSCDVLTARYSMFKIEEGYFTMRIAFSAISCRGDIKSFEEMHSPGVLSLKGARGMEDTPMKDETKQSWPGDHVHLNGRWRAEQGMHLLDPVSCETGGGRLLIGDGEIRDYVGRCVGTLLGPQLTQTNCRTLIFLSSHPFFFILFSTHPSRRIPSSVHPISPSVLTTHESTGSGQHRPSD
jgi:hypothetical protein